MFLVDGTGQCYYCNNRNFRSSGDGTAQYYYCNNRNFRSSGDGTEQCYYYNNRNFRSSGDGTECALHEQFLKETFLTPKRMCTTRAIFKGNIFNP